MQLPRAFPDGNSKMRVCVVGARGLSCGSNRTRRGVDLRERDSLNSARRPAFVVSMGDMASTRGAGAHKAAGTRVRQSSFRQSHERLGA